MGSQHAAAENLPSRKGRALPHRKKIGRVDGIGGLDLEDRKILARGKTETAARIVGKERRKLFERNDSLSHKLGIKDREGGLKTDDSKRAARKSLCLFLCAMGSVIGRDHIDRSVDDSLKERIAIRTRAKRRVHLEPTVLLQIILAKHESKKEIMRAISETCGMQSKAKGLVMSLPIDSVMGI